MTHTLSKLDEAVITQIAYARKSEGLSQEALAQAMNDKFNAGWFQQTVQKIETGACGVSAGEYIAVAALLDIKMWVEL